MPRTAAADRVTRPSRLTVRLRLTLTYAALFTIAGSVMLVLIYTFMRYVPTYAITSIRATAGAVGRTPLETATPIAGPGGVATYRPAEGLTSADGAAALIVSDQGDILNTLLVWSLIVLVALAGVSAWAGWILAGRLLRPLQEINRAAQRAAAGSLDHRVALAGPRDEITDLSDTVDHMLERLERSFQAHQRFAANASHELRTPLATTQAMLDVAAQDEHLDEATFRDLIARLRDTNTRSIRTVEAILDLADLGHAELGAAEVGLDEIVADAVAAGSAAAAARGLRCTTDLEECSVLGDAGMLQQLCGNLVQNAVRHNVDGGFVHVSLARAGTPAGAVVLRVENSGEHLPAEVVARLTEPFYRVGGRVAGDAERSRGLGLAIVESIAEVHGAELRLAARPSGGLVVTVTFPACGADAVIGSAGQRAGATRSPRAHTKKPASVNAP
jgi:two-component system sensor histidine kinase VanS